MKGLWNDNDAAQYRGDLGRRVYTSRLLGRNPALGLLVAVECSRLDRI
jgi:rhamnose utilization protein RhaD (predicted bifunctional aldolase and dehydrogenase)